MEASAQVRRRLDRLTAVRSPGTTPYGVPVLSQERACERPTVVEDTVLPTVSALNARIGRSTGTRSAALSLGETALLPVPL